MTIVVTGATGKVGRHIVEKLVAAGERVRAVTRRPDRARFPAGVEVAGGDLTTPPTLAAALRGATGLHLITTGGSDYATLRTGRELVALAERSGVRRVTVLWNGEEGPVEEAVRASALDWTVLQPVEFMGNALTWADSIRSEGVVREPFGSTRSAAIHEADIAAAAVEVLRGGAYAGRTLTLTGPEALTVPQKVRAIGEAIGRELHYVELSEYEARERWRGQGYSAELIEMFVSWFGDPPPQAYTVLPTVEQITGHAPRTFARWAAEHRDAFRAAGLTGRGAGTPPP